jgi:hypothetical protein
MHRKRVALRSWKNASLAMRFKTFRQRTSHNAQNVPRYEDTGSRPPAMRPVPRLVDRHSRVLHQLVATL